MNSAHIEFCQHLPFQSLRAALLQFRIYKERPICHNYYCRNSGRPVKENPPKKRGLLPIVSISVMPRVPRISPTSGAKQGRMRLFCTASDNSYRKTGTKRQFLFHFQFSPDRRQKPDRCDGNGGEDDSIEHISIQIITRGKHGTVNGKTGRFQQGLLITGRRII